MDAQGLYPRARFYYRTLVPLFEKPKVAAYTMLVLSFFTISFFGMFAIRPTLATIAQLRKQISDQQVVLSRMEEKITALVQAQQSYEAIKPDLDSIFEALPENPELGSLVGKLNRSLVANNMEVVILQFLPVTLSKPEVLSSEAVPMGFTMALKAQYDDILTFVDFLSRTDRIISIDSIDISGEGQVFTGNLLTATIRGRAYVLR